MIFDQKFLILLASFGSVVLAEATNRDLQIDPVEVNVDLLPGDNHVVTKTISTMKVPQNLELCLLSDATASFGDDQGNLRAASEGIATDILAESPDTKFGYAAFKDTGDDFVYRLLQPLSTDVGGWLDAIDALNPNGGADLREAQWDGIACATDIAKCPVGPRYSNADCGFSDPSDPSRKVLIVTTDAPFSNDADIQNDEASTTAALTDAAVTLIGLKAPGSANELDILADATGGSTLSLTSDGSNIADAILTGLGLLPTTVTTNPVCDPGVTISFDQDSQEVTSGSDAIFQETIQIADDPDSCHLECSVEFLSNGVAIGTQTVTVTVTDIEPPTVTCPPSVTVSNDAGACNAVVDYPVPTATDNCSLGAAPIQLTAGLVSGSVFPVGTTANTWEVMDASGNTGSCSFDITVVDTEGPTADCLEGVNPGGRPPRAQNQDGFFMVGGSDNCDRKKRIAGKVWDAGLDGEAQTGDDHAFSADFPIGGTFKYVEAPGSKKYMEKAGPGQVDWRLTGKGDAYLILTDSAGNPSEPVFCRVPPAPSRLLRGINEES